MNVENSSDSKMDWLKRKINYGATYKGMITFTVVWLFVIILFLSTFSEPIELILGQPLLPISLSAEAVDRAGRIIILYHSIAVPVVAVCTYFVLMLMDVREKFKSRVKWPLFLGSILTSASGILFAYIFPDQWILHGLYLVGLSLCFYAGIMLLLGVFPTKSFPKRDADNSRNVVLGQSAVTLLTFCILLSVILGGAIGSFFGNGLLPLLAEYFLRPYDHDKYPELFVDAIKAHLHIMLALIDVIILLVVYRYTVPDQKGKWYRISMILAMPGMLIMSIGSWAVTFNSVVVYPFDMHYLIYVGAAILVTVGLILALTGWNKMSKKALGDNYESASWFARSKAVFSDPVKFTLYFQLIWVNFVMTFGGIFLALSLRGPTDPEGESPFTKVLDIVAFRDGPLAVETTVARGHWHILATLSAIMLVLLLTDVLNIQGTTRKVMGWLSFAGNIVAFGLGMIYLYYPHFDQDWAVNLNKYVDVREFWADQKLFGFGNWLPLVMDFGIMLLIIVITIFCFHQLIQIIKGRHDVKQWPE
ncbi:hypothetical protein CEE45_09880 [Candidatus Heimdallarchaeota archaeon B3_Heim]|nr:MAG: hypothetical protein CEE45_09880 [Candidatus Heimdallarchaeota archaeon B3_Heim]